MENSMAALPCGDGNPWRGIKVRERKEHLQGAVVDVTSIFSHHYVVFQMSLVSGKKRGWKREDMVAIQDPKDKRSCGFRGTDELYSNDQLWTLLKKYDLQKALMSILTQIWNFHSEAIVRTLLDNDILEVWSSNAKWKYCKWTRSSLLF